MSIHEKRENWDSHPTYRVFDNQLINMIISMLHCDNIFRLVDLHLIHEIVCNFYRRDAAYIWGHYFYALPVIMYYNLMTYGIKMHLCNFYEKWKPDTVDILLYDNFTWQPKIYPKSYIIMGEEESWNVYSITHNIQNHSYKVTGMTLSKWWLNNKHSLDNIHNDHVTLLMIFFYVCCFDA